MSSFFTPYNTEQFNRSKTHHGVRGIEINKLERSFFNQWKVMNRDFPHFGSTSGISSKMWWINLVKGTFKDVLEDKYDTETVDKIASELYSYYHTSDPYLVLDDGLESLKRMKDLKLKIGAISNFDNRLHDIITLVGLREFVDFVVTAEDARSSKPEKAIFELAASKSNLEGLKAKDVLHIGDDVEKDYLGARSVGWNSVLVDRKGGMNHVDFRVENLTHIFNIKSFSSRN